MNYEWDDLKDAANLDKHGVGFASLEAFDWDTSLTQIDKRRQYQEIRLQTLGKINGRLHFLVHTKREPDICRVISLRHADPTEKEIYEKIIRQKKT